MKAAAASMTQATSGPTIRANKRLIPPVLAIQLAAAATGALADESGDWPLHGHDSAEQRHSPLDRIHTGNVEQLGLAFEFNDFVVRGRTHRAAEATPIAIDGKLYFTGPWSVVYALDGTTGELLWVYDPGVPGQWARKACCDAVNRGVAVAGDRVYLGTLDGHLDAIDIETGKRVWRTDTLIDRDRAYTITGAPRLAGDRIVIGNGGGDLGVRGYVSAYDHDGDLQWRFFTVPGEGLDEHPEVTQARSTWSPDSLWRYGLGGTAWDSMAYDPDLNLVYVGVGNGSPWPAWLRSPGGGDNLFLSSILALDAATGRMKWHYQTTPGDSWDYAATQHMILTNLVIDGAPRRVIMQAPKNGFFYVLDRRTGELISARAYTDTTWATEIDMATGRPVVSEDASYHDGARSVRPSLFGGHNWQPMSFHPATGLVYVPVLEADMLIRQENETLLPDSINVHARVADAASPAPLDPLLGETRLGQSSRLRAWDPVLQREVWSSLPMPWWGGGVLTTAGGLAVMGSSDGGLWFFDAADGTALRRIETGTAILAAPISYAVEGRQFIAVLAGFGGAAKAFPPNSAPLQYENYERLLVFGLGGGSVDVPSPRGGPQPAERHAQRTFDNSLVAQGRDLYFRHCARCHAYRGEPNGYPNLWNLPAPIYDAFEEIVRLGSMAEAGMPGYSDVLDSRQTTAIREFLLADEARFGEAQ